MLTRIYKTTDIHNKEIYLLDEAHAIAKPSSHEHKGQYVNCFQDQTWNSYHEVSHLFSGRKLDPIQLIKKGSPYYGGNEYLMIDDIKNLSDGFYDASFSMQVRGDDEYSAGDKTYAIQLNKTGAHYAKEHFTGNYLGGITHGLVLHITGNTYTLYSKVNQFTPSPAVNTKNTDFKHHQYQSNMKLFAQPLKEEKSENGIVLTETEKQYLDDAIKLAQNNAMKEIMAARLTQNKPGK